VPYIRKQLTTNGSYTVYVGKFPVRSSLTRADADHVMESLRHLKAPRDWSEAA
jgi:hypothetical protein